MDEALIIDDNRVTAQALRQMLKVLGYPCQVIHVPNQAMDLLNQGFKPLFVCLDLHMPGIGGFDILRYMRTVPALAPVPVFVVTSDDQPETRRKALELGATDLIIKPATFDALEAALATANLD